MGGRFTPFHRALDLARCLAAGWVLEKDPGTASLGNGVVKPRKWPRRGGSSRALVCDVRELAWAPAPWQGLWAPCCSGYKYSEPGTNPLPAQRKSRARPAQLQGRCLTSVRSGISGSPDPTLLGHHAFWGPGRVVTQQAQVNGKAGDPRAPISP